MSKDFSARYYPKPKKGFKKTCKGYKKLPEHGKNVKSFHE